MEFGRVGRVVVADDEPVVRRGLRTSVESTGAFHVVAEAADGHEAVEAVRAHLPDILLLDIHMPRMDGLEATAALRAPDSGAAAHIVVTTGLGLDADVERALALGADAFLPKDAPREELLAALRAVQEGDAALSPPALRSVLDGLRTPAAAQRREARERLEVLSAREAEVLGLVAEGLANRAIGERLQLTRDAVKDLVGRMLAELDAANRLQLALLAHTAGPEGEGPPR
ncbi:response regulator transcription factor [Streptomyces sp. NBC_00320]|uniref:response regulator n=1 Tax=Streptomyces sp. NBC_00320 TaxID=2975711 RepID=UPI00224D0A59|nr:response regulator transcription factor [Streptomyces sp. NBC_00320]MCX5151107.1 response regulator transcription factor [Streptomyces sp. NBC_00320]